MDCSFILYEGVIGIDISNIRNVITNGIKAYTDLITVNTDNPHKKPPYPYYSYKMTTLYKPMGHEGTRLTVNDEGVVKETVILQPQMTISFNSYSNNILEANEKALKAWEWFKFAGYYHLKNNNLVVVDVMPVQDRTTFLTVGYEYRQGFDVILRTVHKIEREIETIEEYNIKESD